MTNPIITKVAPVVESIILIVNSKSSLLKLVLFVCNLIHVNAVFGFAGSSSSKHLDGYLNSISKQEQQQNCGDNSSINTCEFVFSFIKSVDELKQTLW
ncbi:unnamed protein product [Moneuplotes crassus]|uniref:Uncharacterized protein n=1 Tax=Euplotes crassus TaxID=5936 RepID=A0AAD1Y7M8_EUPCR|nr:unnamed protein product [Moneuplotes crassus]